MLSLLTYVEDNDCAAFYYFFFVEAIIFGGWLLLFSPLAKLMCNLTITNGHFKLFSIKTKCTKLLTKQKNYSQRKIT